MHAVMLIIMYQEKLRTPVCRHLPPAKVLGLVLAVSLVWHSVLLYKDAVATQQVSEAQYIYMHYQQQHVSINIINLSTYLRQVKLMADTPPECRPGEMSVLQSVRSFVSQGFSSVDKCAEYQKVGGGLCFVLLVKIKYFNVLGTVGRSNLRDKSPDNFS